MQTTRSPGIEILGEAVGGWCAHSPSKKLTPLGIEALTSERQKSPDTERILGEAIKFEMQTPKITSRNALRLLSANRVGCQSQIWPPSEATAHEEISRRNASKARSGRWAPWDFEPRALRSGGGR